MYPQAIQPELAKELENDYVTLKLGTKKLLSKYHCTWHSLYSALSRFGIPLRGVRRCSVNEFFFETPTPASLWVLGLWITDGSVDHTHLNAYCSRIGFSDEQLLTTVHSLLASTSKISYSAKKRFWSFSVSSKHMGESLVRLGVIPKKTKRIQLPDCSNELMHHLVRGIFDGDGCFYINKQRPHVAHTNFVSSCLPFLEKLQTIINDVIGTTSYLSKVSQSNCYKLEFHGINARTLSNWMYQDSQNIRYEAKYQKYLRFISGC